jgi:hypothetical protein
MSQSINPQSFTNYQNMDWTKEEINFLKKLSDPDKIQGFLDSIDYNPNSECRSPRWVIKKRSAHYLQLLP